MTAATRHPFSEGYGAAWFGMNVCPWEAGTADAYAWWLGYARGRKDKAEFDARPVAYQPRDETVE